MAKSDETIRCLVAPLDWGLGHATRCVPVINRLVAEGEIVILAGSGTAKDFLKSRFPELEIVDKPGYNIRYYKGIPAAWSIVLQFPKILFAIWREHRWLRKVIRSKQIDQVISDNCYGLWNANIHSVFMTHQLMVKCPTPFSFLEFFFRWVILGFINRYDECWIPDVDGENNLSGDLAHRFPIPSNATYIGALSRLKQDEREHNILPEYEMCILLSGPEPQRSKFEKLCVGQLMKSDCNAIVVQGKPGLANDEQLRKGLRVVSHLDDQLLVSIILKSNIIVCRSGYSTLMELISLGKKAILVPTPGQTEQEYLASHFNSKHGFQITTESKLDLNQFLLDGPRKKTDERKNRINVSSVQ